MGIFSLFGQGTKDESKFKFSEPENTAVFTCDHVLDKERPVLFASHDNDGDWQFMCGHDDHTEGNAKLISLKQAVDLDNSINDLYEMPLGYGAQRKSVGAKWVPFKF